MKHKTSILGLVALMVALAMPANAQTQRQLDNKNDLWWNALELQLANNLDSPVAKIQEAALQHIVFFANNYSDKVDFTDLTPEIMAMYENDELEAKRTLALVALSAIGNEQTMIRLFDLVKNEQSKRIHDLTLAVLAEYYGG